MPENRMLTKSVTIVGVGVVGILGLVMLIAPEGNNRRTELAPVGANQATTVAGGEIQDTSAPHEEPARQSSRVTSDEKQTEHTEHEQQSPLEATKESLSFFATESLNGGMHINDVLADVAEIAALQVSGHPDLDYEDDDAIAYEFLGVPEGMRAHMLMGLQPYERDGHQYRYVQMNIDIEADSPELLDGALRDGPNINLSMSYDTETGAPSSFALMLQRRVDLHASRHAGIDAYTGRYTSGAYYVQDLLDSSKPVFATTVGIVDGAPIAPREFAGASLVGDTRLEQELLKELLARLQRGIGTVTGR